MDFPLDFKRGLKAIWAKAALGSKSSFEDWKISHLRNYGDPLTETLKFLALQNAGHLKPAEIPRISPLPIDELCGNALLFSLYDEPDAAAALFHSIPLDFPWLWCQEDDYREEETFSALFLMQAALERKFLGDNYFQSLARHLANLPESDAKVLDWTKIQAERIHAAITFTGSRTSLGVIVTDGVEIRAFGPQTYPLSDPLGFGIRLIAQHGNRWASPSASPEIWFETKARGEENKILLDLTFFGLKPQTPLAISFYIKADFAQIGNERLMPATLQRYHGANQSIHFQEMLFLECLTPGKMEVIPLAGKGGFWDCDYLAAFEIHPVNAKISFAITN